MGLTRPRFSQFDTTISSISDPITVLNKSSTLANVDVGFILNRDGGTSSNVALFWQESAGAFALAFTSNTGEITGSTTNSNIAVTTYANLILNSLTANSINTNGNVTATYFLGSGQFLSGLPANYSNVNVAAYLGGNITVGNIIVPTGAGRFNGPFNESTTVQGVYVGNLNLSPRIGFFNGTASQNWQIDNNFGTFRWYTPGVTRMTIDTGGNLNVPSGNIMTAGNVTASYFFGNGSQLSGVITSVIKIINGTSDVTAYSGGNVAVTVGGTANTVVFTSSNTFIKGSLIPTANITYDLGSHTNRFRSAYFAGSTIYIGNAALSESMVSAIPMFPTGDYGDVTTATVDAFGITSATSFDLNAVGAITTTDLEVLT